MMNKMKSIIIGNIEKYMTERHINQADLAHMLGVSTAYVSMLLNGRRNFSMKVLSKLAEALQVDPDDLTRNDVLDTAEFSIRLRGKAESGAAKEAIIDWLMEMDDFVRISSLAKRK